MKLPNIVQGNDFKMAVNVYTVEVIDEEEIKKDFDVSTSTDIKVYLVKSNNANGCIDKYEVPFEISEEQSNVIYIIIKGINLPLGSYGLEITGVDQYEYHWRFKAKIGELFNIVDATSASSYDNSTYIDFDASIGVIGNNLISEIKDIVTIMVDNLIGDVEEEIEDIQNDVETINQRINSINTNLENKANKNDLATVATTGNYNDLINKPNLFSGDYNDLINKPIIPTVPTNVSAFINDAGYLTQHQSLANYVQFTDLASVATSGDYDDLSNKPNLFSGDYNDLTNKPTIPTVPTNVSAFINDAGYLTEHQSLANYVQFTDLASVATSGNYNDLINKPNLFSGDYNDLTNKPTIPTVPTNVSAFINDAGYLTEHQSLVNYVQFNDLASVATSGDYDDLTNKPVIPVIPTNVSAFINDAGYLTEHQDLSAYALKSELFSGDYNDLTNKPTLFSGDYNDLTNKPTIPTVPTNVSAFINDAGYLTQHQSLANYVQFTDLASVATSGDYDDLSNKPNLFSGDYNDLTNKPTIPTVPTNVSAFTNDAGYLTQHQSLANYVQFTDLASVATSGDYDDLSNKPTLFSGNYNDLTNKPTIPTVPTNVSAFINDAGYLTQHQSLANYYTKSEVDDKIENVEVDLDDYYTKYETDDLFIKDYSKEYLTFESLEDNNVIGFMANNSSSLRTIQVSTDKTNWTSYTSSTEGTTLATLNTGDKLYVKGSNDYHANNNLFTSTKQFNVSGNIMSLIYSDNFIGQTELQNTNTFVSLFNGCIHLINASNLILPATTLVSRCYHNMFSDCPSLITAPELPATTLANGCYAYMFDGCTSLTTAPELPATTLVEACYDSMFDGCSSLNYIKAMFTNVDAGAGYIESWVSGVSSSGTFIKNKDAMWNVIGDDGIPTGWTIKSGDYAYESDLFSGNYNDLTNKPTIPTVPTNVSAFINDAGYLTQHQDLSAYALKSELFSGDYNDLTNKPTIPTVPTNVSAFTNDAGYLTQHQSLANYVQFTDLASVATSGDYDDLSNKPNLFSGDYDDLTNKPTLFSGNYNDLTNKPTNVSSFTNDAGYLTQHQSLTNYVQFTDLASVATSGDYDDLTNKPTLFSGNYNDLTNKPTLFSGDYNDLTNKPTIPTVPTNVSAFTNDAGYLTQHQSLANYVSSTTSGLKIEVVSAMPANPDQNTIYIVQ